MAAIVQRLERLIVVQDVVGSNPTSRPSTSFSNSVSEPGAVATGFFYPSEPGAAGKIVSSAPIGR